MSDHCLDYWQSCGGVFEAIISELPSSLQDRIRGHLRVLAEAQEKQGHFHASHFARMVSGEAPPVAPQRQTKRAHLRLVK